MGIEKHGYTVSHIRPPDPPAMGITWVDVRSTSMFEPVPREHSPEFPPDSVSVLERAFYPNRFKVSSEAILPASGGRQWGEPTFLRSVTWRSRILKILLAAWLCLPGVEDGYLLAELDSYSPFE